MKKLCIAGSRGFRNINLIVEVIGKLKLETIIVTGGAQGADHEAEKAARARGMKVDIFYADWTTHGRAAGMIRNGQLIEVADGLIAFWDGTSRGTADTIRRAREKGIWIRIYREDGNWTK